MEKRRTLAILTSFITLVLLIGCAPEVVELPPAPASISPLVEYSVDGEVWQYLTKDEVKNLRTTTVHIRKTEKGMAFGLLVVSDLSVPRFHGQMTKAEGIITVKGSGAVMIHASGEIYAKIVLE